MKRFPVDFHLRSGQTMQAIIGHYGREQLIYNIKQRLDRLTYWDLEQEDSVKVLKTAEVVAFEVGIPEEVEDSQLQSFTFTFKGLIYSEKKLALEGEDHYILSFPDLDLIEGRSTMIETIQKGKEYLKSHLEILLEEQRDETLNSPYIKHPSKTVEEAQERHLLNMSEIYDDEELREIYTFIKAMDFTVTVEVDLEYEKYYLENKLM